MNPQHETGAAITEAGAGKWLDLYKTAWVQRDVTLALPLFTADVDYHDRRFGTPLRNYGSLEDYWRGRIGEHQRDVRFQYQIWAVKDDECFAGFQAQFLWLPINGVMELDGVMRIQFLRDGDGELKCCKFEEWMERRES